MTRHLGWKLIGLAALLLGAAAPAAAQTFNSGSTGADGAFAPTSNVTVPLPPNGIFNFTTIDIPAGVTVRFAPNATNTPVTLLASGNVNVAGTIDVSGVAGGMGSSQTLVGPNGGAGGPGGFAGGTGTNGIVTNIGGAGLGPGGGKGNVPGSAYNGGGGFGTAGGNGCMGSGGGSTYGTQELLPLIGGSGGGGAAVVSFGPTGGGGGGGGGAVLIASSGTMTLTGAILAKGGAGGAPNGGPDGGAGGSGGAVRLVATTIAGTGGSIDVRGAAGGISCDGVGGVGRIRVESFNSTAAITFQGPQPSLAAPTSIALTNAPTLRITAIGGVEAPETPAARFAAPDIVLPAATTNPVPVAIAATNVPPGTVVTVRVQGQVGAVTTATATLTGTQTSTTASVNMTIPTNQPSVVCVTASFTMTAAGAGPFYVEGELVEQVRVAATPDGASQVTYVTRSGREVVLAR